MKPYQYHNIIIIFIVMLQMVNMLIVNVLLALQQYNNYCEIMVIMG
jgi:hypothetical protein